MAADLGLPVVGWKVGAATPAIMSERHLDAPIPGPLFEPRVFMSPAELPATDFATANLETEFAFRTLAELPPRRAPYEPASLAAMSALHGAFDLTQSRYSLPPDPFSEIADAGNSGGAVIGPAITDWRQRDLLRTIIELRVDRGAAATTYTGAWRRDPLSVFTWLVNSLSHRGIGLPAGSFVLTGSVTEPQLVRPGNCASARFASADEVCMCILECANP